MADDLRVIAFADVGRDRDEHAVRLAEAVEVLREEPAQLVARFGIAGLGRDESGQRHGIDRMPQTQKSESRLKADQVGRIVGQFFQSLGYLRILPSAGRGLARPGAKPLLAVRAVAAQILVVARAMRIVKPMHPAAFRRGEKWEDDTNHGRFIAQDCGDARLRFFRAEGAIGRAPQPLVRRLEEEAIDPAPRAPDPNARGG